jgi:peptide chain release factor 1
MTGMEPQLSPDLIKIMDQRLSAIEHRNAVLQKLINQPEYSPEEFSRANKELRKLRDSMLLINDLRAKQKVVNLLYRIIYLFQRSSLIRFTFCWQEIDGLKSLVSESSDDKDMLDLAVGELDEAVEEEKRLQTLLLKSLLPKDEADERDCILEVRAGTLVS